MKILKQEELKSGQVVLFDYKGKTHEGIVEVEGKLIFICQDVRIGAPCKNKHGKGYSYALCLSDGNCFCGEAFSEFKNIRLKPKPNKKGKSVKKAPKPVIKYDHDKVKVNENECISAKTEEEAVKITSKLNELGVSWSYTFFPDDKEKTVYYPHDDTFDCYDFAVLNGHRIITCDEWLARFNDSQVKRAPKYVFENQFKLDGQDFDIVAHREKIARLKAELKEAQEIEKAFVKFNQK